MSERPPLAEETMGVATRREESFGEVCRGLKESLEVLEEGFQEYSQVTFPNGETREPENPKEQVLGRIQRYKESIEGLLEQNIDRADNNERFVEEALRMSKEAIEHLEGFLAIQADLYILAKRNERAQDLADVLDTVAHTILAPEDGGLK